MDASQTSLDPENAAWNVTRADFDEILLRHAQSEGVRVFEGTSVKSIHFSPTDAARPVSAQYYRKADDCEGTIRFDYLIDCSGRQGIMSTRYAKTRKMNAALKNRAIWGYWRGCGTYGTRTHRENAPFFEALHDETGWAWFIPLHDGTTSVGVVMKEDKSIELRKQRASTHEHYLAQLELAPNLRALMGPKAVFDQEKIKPSLQQASDYSYQAESYAGPYYRIAGDAGCFIDPFFSSGVHLALTGALSAAASVAASIRGDVPELTAGAFHSKKVGTAYLRFLLVVAGVYEQITRQKEDVMSSCDEDNFDRAFQLIRPVIQGATETERSRAVSEEEISQTMNFVKNLFDTDEEAQRAVEAKFGGTDLFKASAPVLTPDMVARLTQDETEQDVLKEVNARKVIHPMYSPMGNFASEAIDGSSVRLQRGHLGLVSGA